MPTFAPDPEKLAKLCEELRTEALRSDDPNEVQLGPLSEQYHLLAVAALEQAARFFTLAEFNRRRRD